MFSHFVKCQKGMEGVSPQESEVAWKEGEVSFSRAGPGTPISLDDTGQWALLESHSGAPFLESLFILL